MEETTQQTSASPSTSAISGLKRRLNGYKSQATLTARKLVGQTNAIGAHSSFVQSNRCSAPGKQRRPSSTRSLAATNNEANGNVAGQQRNLEQRPTMRTTVCQQYNEFDPNCCQYEIINQAKLKQQQQKLIDDQQIVEILSDEEEDDDYHHELEQVRRLNDHQELDLQRDDHLLRNNNRRNNPERDNQVLLQVHTNEQHQRERQTIQHQDNQRSDQQVLEPSHSHPTMVPKSTNLISVSQIARQTSINSQHQSFIRRNSSRRMSSRRRPKVTSNGRELRQVRFQPIPQSIDISNYSSELETSQQQTMTNNSVTYSGHENTLKENNMPKYLKSKHVIRVQQQMSKLSRKSKIHLGSAKPLTKKSLHHLSHLKKNFNKIKLKSINSFAHQIHQTISSASASTSTSSQSSKFKINKLASNDLISDNSIRRINSQVENDHHEEEGGEEEDGWGSDFDEESMASTCSSLKQHQSQPSNGYLLEIGKSNCDTRAIDDVIQDQGISGQFKQIYTSYSCQISVESPQSQENQSSQRGCEEQIRRDAETSVTKVSLNDHEEKPAAGVKSAPDRQQLRLEDDVHLDDSQTVEPDADDDDDEAELRSLEARQGFRQIRDKLSIILDQRLATYERSVRQTAPPAACNSIAACATSRPGERPQVDSTDSGSSSVVVGLTQTAIKTTTSIPSSVSNTEPATTTSSTAITNNTNNAIEQYPFQEQQASPSGSHEFDCQSHCSEASSSSGLDSNHSGHSCSQDSGHSTQHSGYSAIRTGEPAGNQRLRNDTPSTISSETNPIVHLNGCVVGPSGSSAACSDKVGGGSTTSSGSSGISSLSPTATSCCDQRHSTISGDSPLEDPITSSCSPTSSGESDENVERRNRFLQNRLIINGKLESLFKSRTNGPITTTRSDILDKRQTSRQIKSDDVSPSKSLNNYSTTRRPASISSNCSSNQSSPQSIKSMQLPVDGATRSRLLQEQRQMSLKLRQKPRRKTAARALDLQHSHHLNHLSQQNSQFDSSSTSSTTSKFNGSIDGNSITTTDTKQNGSYISSSQVTPSQTHHQQGGGAFVRSDSSGAHGRDSLTKQLSMVCLRQLESTVEGRKRMGDGVKQPNESIVSPSDETSHQSVSSTNVNNLTVSGSENIIDKPKLAMSLRQLVKEVIDDCEKPNKLSTLTRSILNRSDSLSSEGLATSMVSGQTGGADVVTSAKLSDDTRQQQQQFVSLTSCPSSLSARERPSDDEREDENDGKDNIRPLRGVNNEDGDDDDNKKTNDLLNGRQMPTVQPIGPHNGKLMANYRVHSSSSIGLCNISQQQVNIMQSSTPQQTPKSAANQSNLHHDLSQISIADNFGSMSTTPMSPYGQLAHQLHQSAHDISMVSSVGSTIDGLEYSRVMNTSCLNGNGQAINVPTDQQPNRQQQLKASIGAYWKSLRDFSRFKLAKVKLINANHHQQGEHHAQHRLHDVREAQTGALSSNMCSTNAVDDFFLVTNSKRLPNGLAASELYLASAGDEYNTPAANNLGSAEVNFSQPLHQYRQHQINRSTTTVGRPNKSTPTTPSKLRPEATACTIAGAWRRRAKRSSLIDSPMISRVGTDVYQEGASGHRHDHHQQETEAMSRLDNSNNGGGVGGGGVGGSSLANHFVTISNRKWKSCHLRSSLIQMAFNHQGNVGDIDQQAAVDGSICSGQLVGATTTTTSGSGNNKQHLAYLDNSRNFFTDDDN